MIIQGTRIQNTQIKITPPPTYAALTPVNATYTNGVLINTSLPGDWQSGAYSTVAFTNTWSLSLTMPTVSQYVFFGLSPNPNPSTGDYSSQQFNWFIGGSDSTTLNYGQPGTGSATIPATDARLDISYNGNNVIWSVNGQPVSVLSGIGTIGTPLYAEILFTGGTGVTVTDVQFTGT